ncbi:MAG TPA: HAD family hydrolase [Ktedonobacterales bacterium]|jgi:phosphoglycolate phosphatase-like HAD superfamily hydrolase|nr:HAD family hydrolase [Ktedonobacterales bacterium]
MLFLFDIDGTLLRRMPPAHRQALCDAASEVYGVRLEAEDLGQTAGLTDAAIARRMLGQARVPEETIAAGLPSFFSLAARAYERHVPADLTPYHTPHAEEALAWLRERDAHLGLVTGNIERIAWTKLAAAGLAEYFASGAFGDEAEAREELPPRAVERASRLFGRAYAPDEVYVVGDTPADIACGAASWYRTIAVATGPIHSLDALGACGPDYVLEDLGGIPGLDLWR